MNIEEALYKEHSKRLTNAIVAYIGDNPKRFNELMAIFKTNNPLLIQRASWPLGFIADEQPQLILPHLGTLLQLLHLPLHDAYKRNVFRMLRIMPNIPLKHHGNIIEHCMKAITDHNQPGAIRAFAIHVMAILTLQYPDLAHEFKATLETFVHHPLPALRSSSKKALAQLSRIKSK